MVLCSTLLGHFALPNPLSRFNSHTHFHCAVVHEGRKFQVSAFFLFSFWCRSKVNTQPLPSFSPLHTATLQLSVGHQTLCKIKLCMDRISIRFPSPFFFSSTASISHYQLYPEQTFWIASSRHNGPTSCLDFFFVPPFTIGNLLDPTSNLNAAPHCVLL